MNMRLISLAFVLTMALLAGCAQQQKKDYRDLGQDVRNMPRTLAILPFENNAVTGADEYAPLSTGLATMLSTDLRNNNTGLTIIERQQLKALLKEIALSQSGAVDQSTAVQAGRILGAQGIAISAFTVLGNQVRLDSRIIKVETSEVLMAESVSGYSSDFLQLERELAEKVAATLKVVLTPAPEQSGSGQSLDAAVLFAQGVEAFDAGDKATAEELFSKALAKDPSYRAQVDAVLH